MNMDQLRDAILGVDSVAAHVDRIIALAKPSVAIELVDEPLADACSRFGGRPLVPSDFTWPAHPIGEYRFLGQINFAEIEGLPAELPNRGLLSLFYAFDEDGEIFWQDDRYIVGYFWERFEEHVLSTRDFGRVAGIRIRLKGSIDIPLRQELYNDRCLDWKSLTDLRDAIETGGAHMLGYPRYNSLAYDPTPSPTWTHLLQVASFDELDWCWHDGDPLMIFIETEKLAARQFDALKADAG